MGNVIKCLCPKSTVVSSVLLINIVLGPIMVLFITLALGIFASKKEKTNNPLPQRPLSQWVDSVKGGISQNSPWI